MNYPLISEYIEAIKAAEDNFEELSYLSPVLGDDGLPVMTSGNFAVVFKMKDVKSGKFYAVKCFTKEQEGRAEAYREITKEMEKVSSPYILSIRYLEKELFVDTDQTSETEFPVLLMDWVEGKTLDKYLRENLDDKYALEMLAYRFSQLAQWLIPQPFAHGDLKPDNILVREDGTLVLVDYDGMYVPAMKGQKARELGSPDFRHPLRTENDFDEHIDDFTLMSILVSLIGISKYPKLYKKYGATDRLLFSSNDYSYIESHEVTRYLLDTDDVNIKTIACIFISFCHYKFSVAIPNLEKPYDIIIYNGFQLSSIDKLNNNSNCNKNNDISIDCLFEALVDLDELMKANDIDYVLSGSLGLYIHGIVPSAYIPHDIDIVVSNNISTHSVLTNEMKLDLFMQYCGNVRLECIGYDPTDMFVFYIGHHAIEVNAFIDRANTRNSNGYTIMQIMGRNIKVNDALPIFKEKFKLCRLKDYKFNHDIQTTLNLLLNNSTKNENDILSEICEYEEEFIESKEKELIRTFFMSTDYVQIPFENRGIEAIISLFEKDIKTQWILNQESAKYFLYRATGHVDYSSPHEMVIYGKHGEFMKKAMVARRKTLRVYDNYNVEFLYKVLQEMNILYYFTSSISKLITLVKERKYF